MDDTTRRIRLIADALWMASSLCIEKEKAEKECEKAAAIADHLQQALYNIQEIVKARDSIPDPWDKIKEEIKASQRLSTLELL